MQVVCNIPQDLCQTPGLNSGNHFIYLFGSEGSMPLGNQSNSLQQDISYLRFLPQNLLCPQSAISDYC